MDGRTVPDRTIEVLASLNADVIALQEVLGAGPNDSGHAEEIGAALGMGWVMASVRHLRGHQFGNMILSHFPIRQHVQYDLSWRTCEPRCCQRADIVIDDQTLHLFNVHLGTAYRERKDQPDPPRRPSCRRPHSSDEDSAGRFQRVERRLCHRGADEKTRGDRSQDAPETPAHLSRPAASAPPRSHLLQGPGRHLRRRDPAHAEIPYRVRSSAVSRRAEGGIRITIERLIY